MLLIEQADFDEIENKIIEEGLTKEKSYYISGPYIECNIKNKNARIYPGPIVEPQVVAFQQLIHQKRSAGELDHSSSLEIEPKNISHLIVQLEWDQSNKNIVFGKSKVLTTPNGMIVRSLMDAGIKLAVSTRGAGTVKDSIVQSDFKLATVDIVWEPSAPSAFVENIMEAKTEWVINEGILTEKKIEQIQKKIKKISATEAKNMFLEAFGEALRSEIHKSKNGNLISRLKK